MYLSYSWLNEFVKIVDIDPHKIGHRLTMCTSEIESVEEVGGNLDKVVIGKILDVKPHPDSDHLFLTKTDVGSETLDIVSGAPNTVECTASGRYEGEEGQTSGSGVVRCCVL